MKINNLTLFKCFPLFFFNFFILLKCQITFSDQVPFVYYQQNIQLYKLNDHTLQGQSTIDYSSKSFKNIPTVIVGIDFYNNFWNVPDGVNFNISSSQVTQNGCIIQASRLENSNLVGISASALVIDISQYPFFYVTNIEKNNIQFTNFEYSEYFSFSSQLQNQGQKNVSVVLTGWKSSYDYSNKFFALTVEATNITDSGYTIKISTANQAQTIINVYFTVLEYIQNPLSIYGIVSQYDTLYKQQTIIKCFYTTSCQNQQRYFPVKFDVFMQVQKTSYTDFFVSINQFYFNTENSSQDLRISIENQSFSSNTIQYSYYIWDGAKCQGTTSTALQFYKKTCPQGQYLSTNGNDCLTTCLIYLQNNQICLDCSSGQYFLQDQNICSTTQPTGYFCSTQDPKYTFQVCQICNIPNCKECNSAFQCTLCTDSYYLFNGKCFQDQPPNTYCDPQKLICSKCLDNNCLTCSDPSQTSSQCLKCDDKKTQILYQNKCYTQDSPPSNTFCDWKILKCIQCTDVSCLSCSDPTQPSSKCLSCDQSQKLILYEDKCFSQSQPPPNTFCDWNKLTCSKCSDTSCLSCSDPITSPQVCLSCDESLKQILYQCKCYSQSNPPPNTFCDWIQLKCSQCGDKNCLTCKETIQECLQCIDSQSQILYQGKCYTQSSPPKNTFCDWKQMKCTQCADSNCLTCSDPNLPEQQCLQCADSQNQILYEGQCYIQSSPPKNTFCDWKQMKCTQCADSNCLTCSDPSIFPQVCISCDQSKQKLAFFQGKCFTQNSRPDNTFCDWDNLKCFQCLDNNCLSCSNPSEPPQICKSCDITKQQILYEGKCFSQSNPPSNTFCDWSNQQCFKCKDNDCLACTDPSQSPQQCLSCIDSKNSILYQGKCYTQNNPPTNTFCNWSKLKCSQCNNSSCQTCSDPNYPPQICLSCDLSKNKITFQGKCYCGIGLYLDQNNNCSQKCAQGCLLCLNSYSCDKYSDNEVYSGNKCDYSCSQCTIPNKNYGCTECSSKTRQLEKITGSCFCKDGYTNVGIPDCQDDNALKPQQQIQTASDGVLQAVFILYLPQLFINIHPFTDYFIFQMQSLGNLYFVNQNQTEILYKSFATLNFVNIYYQSSEANLENVEFMIGIKYKLIIDKLVSQNLILLLIVLVIFCIFSGIVFILRNKINSSFIVNNFLWNIQLKLLRISSNYYFANLFLNISHFSSMDQVSYILLGIITPVYLINFFIIFNKSKNIDQTNYLFLHHNLDVNKNFNKYFWLMLEVKKVILIISLSFSPIKYYLYLLLSSSLLSALVLTKYKPYLDCLRDSIYLMIGELIMIILCIFPLLIIQIDDYSLTCKITNIANITIMIYVIFQFIITSEYVIRKIKVYRSNLLRHRLTNSINKPIVVDMALEINIENLENILNTSRASSTFLKNQYVKKQSKKIK